MNTDDHLYGESMSSYNKRTLKTMFIKSPLSMGMMVILLLMFLVCFMTDIIKYSTIPLISFNVETLIGYGANDSQLILKNNQYYRLVTAMFLHGGIAHLAFNGLTFMMFLVPVERMINDRPFYFLLMLLGGMMGNMLTTCVAVYIKHSIMLGVGASTTICAVIGTYFAYKILRVDEQEPNLKQIMCQLVYIFIISMLPRVDFFGHFGSLFGGFFMGLAYFKAGNSFGSSQNARKVNILGQVTLGVYFLGLCMAIFAAGQK